MENIIVNISDDYYKAYITVFFKDDFVSEEDLIKALEERNITYGIDMEVIRAIIALKEDVIDELVAEGDPHVHGIDAEVVLTYEHTHDIKPEVDDTGKVNFKELNYHHFVKEGDQLGRKYFLTKGIDGMTVTGKVIHARDGKEVNFLFGENVSISEDGSRLLADCDGIFKMEGEKVTIQKVLEFQNGIGLETGNVRFDGDIYVTGNIINEYAIDCGGNLYVDGLIEGAFLNVQGDITITKGISGHNISTVFCGGDMVVKFLDNTEVTVKGNLDAEEILNCKILCDGEVTVKGKKGHIIGGEITAKYAINATTIGSRLGVITLINLGVDIDSVKELKELKALIEDEREKERKLVQFISILEAKAKKGTITEEESANLIRCYDTIEQCKYIIKEKTERFEYLREMLLKAKNGQIKTETIYPDTLVKIGQSSYFIDSALLRSIIKKSDDEIIAIGF